MKDWQAKLMGFLAGGILAYLLSTAVHSKGQKNAITEGEKHSITEDTSWTCKKCGCVNSAIVSDIKEGVLECVRCGEKVNLNKE